MVIYVRAQTQYYLDIVKSEIFQSCTAYCLEIPKKFSPDFAANIYKTFAELRWLEVRLCSVGSDVVDEAGDAWRQNSE